MKTNKSKYTKLTQVAVNVPLGKTISLKKVTLTPKKSVKKVLKIK